MSQLYEYKLLINVFFKYSHNAQLHPIKMNTDSLSLILVCIMHIFIYQMGTTSQALMRAILLLTMLTYLIQCQNHTEYKIVSKDVGTSFIKLNLQYTGSQTYYVKQKSLIITNLTFQLRCLAYYDFTFKIYDPNHKRYEVPQGGIFPKDPYDSFSYPLSLASFVVTSEDFPFNFQVRRKSDNSILFSTRETPIVFSQYYIQIGTKTSSRHLYGLSQRFTNSFRLKQGKWTIFPRDRGQMMDTGIGKQTHGYYPIYMQRQNGKKYHINYFRSSNALDVIIKNGDNNNYELIYKVIGGIIDFRFFIGEASPQQIVLRFQSYLGRSAIPPFWSLGFHQCRWGYKNVSVLQSVLANYKKNGIPLDTIWSDIDYMKEYQTFTIDEERFSLDQMKQILKQYHYIPIVEPSIRYQKGYAWQEGKKRNVFIKDAEGNDQIGKVWAGQVVFTDYFHPNATYYWLDMLDSLYRKIKFSGVWLDMNEISNLCNGPCSTPQKTGIDYTNDIPYHPGNDSIQSQAIPFNATHYGQLLQANVHTFFGFMETYATNLFLSKHTRPFIITRSNTLGSNKYGFHWTGDNYANFSFLRTSISSNFMFNFWGIQMVGSDICGFGGNATEQNCARWFQLGSMYPFARNHNEIQAIDQQPYSLGPRVLKSSKLNIKLRYSILKQYYRLFISNRGYGFIFKPLFFSFFDDQNTFNDEIADTQFMLGEALMGAPILQSGTISRLVYFPFSQLSKTRIWYNLHDGTVYEGGMQDLIINQMDDLIPLFIRQGHTILRQNTEQVLKSSDLNSQFILYSALHLQKQSQLEVYSSEGSVLSIRDYENQVMLSKCINSGCEYKMKIELSYDKKVGKKELKIGVKHEGSIGTNEQIIINEIVLYSRMGVIRRNDFKPISITKDGAFIIPIVEQLIAE